jgi:hypothetical protein
LSLPARYERRVYLAVTLMRLSARSTASSVAVAVSGSRARLWVAVAEVDQRLRVDAFRRSTDQVLLGADGAVEERVSALDGADLSLLDLSGADLTGTRLRNANLENVKLREALFSQAT